MLDSGGPKLKRGMKSEDFIPLVQSEGHGATATTAKHAAQQADIVMLLVPWPAMETITRNLGDMGSKVMIDVP